MKIMKRPACILLTVLMLTSFFVSFAKTEEYYAAKADIKSEAVRLEGDKAIMKKGAYLGFKDVDLTGIRSVTVTADCLMPYGENGDALSVRLDSPVSEAIGYIVINSEEEKSFTGNIKESSGVHTLYLCSTYAEENYIVIKSVKLNETARVYNAPVSDDKIKDVYSDTWQAADCLGRRVADFAEAGPVKEGDRYAGIMYWDWHTYASSKPYVIKDVIAENPGDREDYDAPSWDKSGVYYWSEPLLGFYTSFDYFVYRKHAVWLKNAGIDVIFYDYTNLERTYVKAQRTMMRAWHDARESGVDVPKISAYFFNPKNQVVELKSLWFNLLNDPEYSDLVFKWEGKHLVCGWAYDEMEQYINKNDPEEVRLIKEICESVNFRTNGSREKGPDVDSTNTPEWQWLENYPLHNWGKARSDGRVEQMAVGASINHSYVYGYSAVGLASDPYTKGRGYSEAFGEDYTENNARSAAFFREQASQALDTDPAFIYIDGWNEYTAIRNREFSGFKNSFVDTYDDENSRDFEPSSGALGDDYYLLLCDFIRKYKGVRPAPLASEEKTIDITGGISQWDGVLPEFLNDDDDYARSAELVGGEKATGGAVNSIVSAKVARDSEKVYFLVKTKNAVNENTAEFLHLYINSDRNFATGWNGYDIAAGRKKGVLERWENGAWVTLGSVRTHISGNAMTLEIERSAIGRGADFEFKWVDSSGEIASGNILDVYKTGSAAPMGRFNYLYTDAPERAITGETKKALSDTLILMPGRNKMVTDGSLQYVYEKDIRVTPFEMNGTLYVPKDVFEEAMYGESKIEYDAGDNILRVKAFRLENREITDYTWTYTVLGSREVRINGRLTGLTAPAAAANGIIYIPVTYLSDCFGWTLTAENGAYILARGRETDKTAVNEALGFIK